MKRVRILNLEPAEEDSRRVRAALEKTFDLVWQRAADERGLRALLSSEEWDVVVSCDEAVGLTGIAAHEIVADDGRDIPFIILADAIDQEAALAAMRLGVNDYLAKDDLIRLAPAVARELHQAENRRARKAAEKALAESEDRLRLALRAGGIGAWEWDLKTNDAVWSPETSAIVGIPIAGSTASVFREIIFPADLQAVENARRIAVEARRSFDVKFRIRRRGGDVRWIAASGKCEFDDADEPARIVGTVRDITRDKEAEEALRRSEHDFRALVQASTHYVWEFDETGAPLGRQEWWEHLTGQPFDESLNFGWLECIHSGDRERVRTVYEDSLASGMPIDVEMRIRERSGEYRYYAASGVPVADPEGNRWICALKDIHDQRSVEQRYRVVSTISSDYVFSGRVDENGQVTLDWLTGAFERITGYEVDEFNALGGWRAIVHADDREKDQKDFARLLRNESVETEIRIVNKSGGTAWVRVCVQPIWDQRRDRLAGLYGAVQDITESKSAELAVREHEAYLQSVLNAEPECVKVFGRTGEIIDINPAGLAILEADSEDDVIGKPELGVIREEDAEQFREALERAWNGETVTVGYRIVAFKGTKRCMEMRAAPIRDAGGSITSVLGVSRDITEKHRIEAALMESEKQYADLINTIDGIVWEVDAETMRFTFVSRQAESILGYPVARWLEKDFWPDHIHPEDRDRAIDYCMRESAKGDGHTFDYRMIAADGRVVWIRDIVSVVMGNGNPKILRGLMVDVTEQRRRDAAMKQQALLIEQANEAIFVWDLDGGVIEWNRGCEALYGYRREEVLGKFAYDVLRTTPPDSIEAFRAALAADGTWSGEVTQTTRSGELVLVDSRAQLIELDGRKAVLQTSRDITEMRRAEDALRRSELRYRHLFENNPYPMWVYDTETLCFLAVNDSAVMHYGYTAEEFCSMKITDIRPADDVGLVLERAALTVRQVDKSGQWRHLKKDGTVINVQITSHALDFEGRHARLVLANDVTDRLRAEKALRQSEAKYRELVANANDIIYTHDLKGRFTSLNHAGERITGYTEEEAKRMSVSDVLPPELMSQARAMVEKKIAAGTTTIYETELIAKDGRRVPIEVNSRMIFEDGRPVAVQGIARDFSERRRTEEELRRHRERLDKTAEAAPVMICSLHIAKDGTRTFPFASPASVHVFGFTPEELEKSADAVFDRILPEYLPDIQRIMRKSASDSAPVQMSYEYEHPTRGRVWVETYAAPTRDKDDGRTWHGIAADITEQRNAEAALVASEEQLRQSQKLESIGILAGGLAHDFNNMLTAINGYSDLILRRVATDDPVRRHVEEIKKAGERSAELTRQLLAFSRRQILQPTTLDINGSIADTASMLKRLIGEDIAVTTKLAPDLGLIQADQGQLAQVLMNLLINARDAMPKGGSVMIETANVELDEDYASRHVNVTPGPYVMLAISDTGVGMDEQTRLRVFEPFFTTKPIGKGTGLGLSTVYGIVKQSGGNIWVYSEPGKGSTFKIYLPQTNAAETRPAPRGAEQRNLHLGHERILLVEDEDTVRGLARQILEACGYEVFEAANGAEAFTKFKADLPPVDLLITDIVMPEMGGRELSEKVLLHRPATKVLFTSGYTDDAIVRHGIIDEGKNFLQKPFTFDGLARKVRSVLDGAAAGRLKGINN